MTTTLPTACPLDCPDGCSLTATVGDDGRLVALDGDHRNPFTAGFVCAKVRGFGRHLDGDDRIATPLLRTGPKGAGQFTPIGWDEALDRVAEGLADVRARHGGEAILPLCYGGSNGALSHDCVDARLFRRLGAARLARTVCAAPSGRAAQGLYGKMPGVALPDYAHASLIVLWGANPSVSGTHLVPVLRRARANGATLVVVDPRRTPLAKQADLHLPVRPGTDLPLALALGAALLERGHADLEFLAAHGTGLDRYRERARAWSLSRAAEVCGLELAAIEELLARYVAASPAVVRCGWGPERNRNGGSAIAAILALPALAGKFGVRAGGYTMSNSRALALHSERAIAEPEPATVEINMNQVGRVLLEQPARVHALFVYDSNPLATLPHQRAVQQGLARDDLFTVVFEQVMTDTARWADVVLPATTFLEHDELRTSYGALAVQRARPVMRPRGEARSNLEVFTALCDRMGLSRPDDPRGVEALTAIILEDSALPEVARAGLEAADLGTLAGGVQFVDVFPGTADRRVHLCPDALDRECDGGLYHYRELQHDGDAPLTLISPAVSQRTSSTFGQLDRRAAAVHVNPEDAEARSLREGDRVRVFNAQGEVHCRVSIDADVRPGVAVLAKGLWSHHTDNGATANALAPDTLADLGGGATFNDARVQIERRA
ncbi:MAG: molybdopterin-dependent oxidoreductase [Deltaproteobacteria bacterium]|nr:molybdopterin-dependent oxidoreductase [Deltaproteobacteria bacterium]MBK8714760.1 molybdopterin-dependent oxidoreductase [Deltaproteobacteria bacterium]